MNTLTINSSDAIWIGRDLYCKTPEALAIALEQAQASGYEIKDERTDGYSVKEGRVTPEQMEQKGWALWYLSLNVQRGKCGSCNSYITTRGIRAHGTTCGVCGAVLYRDIIEGSTVRFEFIEEERKIFGPQLVMQAKRWDDQNGWLYLKYEFLKGGMCVLTGQEAEQYITRHASKWEIVEENGEKLLKVHYTRDLFVQPDAVISVLDIWGNECNSKIVRVWDGKEYDEYDRLPVPESFQIYETWHWAPLPSSPTLHKRVLSAVGNTDDKGWHYQDGRQWFRRETFDEMGKFVRHFTTLDADAWDEQSPRFRLDGPGGIDDVAAFCHPDAEVENRPNIGNFLTAVTGMDRSLGNLTLAAEAIDDDEITQEFATALIKHHLGKK